MKKIRSKIKQKNNNQEEEKYWEEIEAILKEVEAWPNWKKNGCGQWLADLYKRDCDDNE